MSSVFISTQSVTEYQAFVVFLFLTKNEKSLQLIWCLFHFEVNDVSPIDKIIQSVEQEVL